MNLIVICSHFQFECCGVSNYTDWYKISAWEDDNWVPDSCCKFETTTCGRSGNPSEWYNAVSGVLFATEGFWLIWYSTKRAYVIMICPSCIVVVWHRCHLALALVSSGVGIGVIGICAQPS